MHFFKVMSTFFFTLIETCFLAELCFSTGFDAAEWGTTSYLGQDRLQIEFSYSGKAHLWARMCLFISTFHIILETDYNSNSG